MSGEASGSPPTRDLRPPVHDTNLFYRLLGAGPVPWRRWSVAARTEAVARDLPILVFCGAALDHWSAAMAAELIGDAQACALIDELFVPVMAEPWAEPALAASVQRALALICDSSGWPACALLLPDGRAFGACPFRPLRDRDGQIGLARILLGTAEAWRERRADCLADGARLAELVALADAQQRAGRPPTSALVLDGAEAAAMAAADPLAGGFGPPPRGLGSALLRFLVQRAARPDAPLALARQLERTLAALVAGAVHDQLGGGFHRGAVDAAWTLPFYEKRLIDQALIARVLLEAHETGGARVWRDVGERALRWAVDHLRGADGGYAAGQHADAPGGEGACYRWTHDQVAALVGAEAAALVDQRFALPDRDSAALAVVAALDDDGLRRLPAILQRLAVARAERPQPPRDERRLPRQQAAMLSALAAAARQAEPDATLVAAGHALALSTAPASDPATIAARVEWMRAIHGDALAVEQACLQAVAELDLATLALDAVIDGEDGPSAVAELLAVAATIPSARDGVRALLDRFPGLLRRSPLASSGLLLVLDRLDG